MNPSNTIRPIRVFISYAWKDHDRTKIERLAKWLNENEEIEVTSDHMYQHNTYPEEGWQIWMKLSIENTDIVLCICGKNHKKAFDNKGGDKDSAWEGAIITNDLHKKFHRNKKYSIILPEGNAGIGRYRFHAGRTRCHEVLVTGRLSP